MSRSSWSIGILFSSSSFRDQHRSAQKFKERNEHLLSFRPGQGMRRGTFHLSKAVLYRSPKMEQFTPLNFSCVGQKL